MDKQQRAREYAQRYALEKIQDRHHRQRLKLESDLQKTYSTKPTIQAEIKAIDRRLSAGGIRAKLRDVFGVTGRDNATRQNLDKTVKNIEQRENEQRQALKKRQELELKKLQDQKQVRAERSQRERPTRGEQSRKRTEKPAPAPPPPREAQRIAQQWAQKVTSVKPETIKREIKTTPVRASSMEQKKPVAEKTQSRQSDISKSWEQAKTKRANDNEQTRKPTQTRQPTRGVKRSP